MIIVIFRHGHKQFSIDENPPLSPKGLEQAKNLEQLIQSQVLPVPTHCWFSPKLRTRQTLESCFKSSAAFTFEKNELNTREIDETTKNFRNRIQKFFNEINARNNPKEIHFVCTHYDWIEEALTVIDADAGLNSYELSSWAPGQFALFELQDHRYLYLKKGVL